MWLGVWVAVVVAVSVFVGVWLAFSVWVRLGVELAVSVLVSVEVAVFSTRSGAALISVAAAVLLASMVADTLALGLGTMLSVSPGLNVALVSSLGLASGLGLSLGEGLAVPEGVVLTSAFGVGVRLAIVPLGVTIEDNSETAVKASSLLLVSSSTRENSSVATQKPRLRLKNKSEHPITRRPRCPAWRRWIQ